MRVLRSSRPRQGDFREGILDGRSGPSERGSGYCSASLDPGAPATPKGPFTDRRHPILKTYSRAGSGVRLIVGDLPRRV